MCFKSVIRLIRHIWLRQAKFSMTLLQSSLVIVLIAVVIAIRRCHRR